MGMKRLILAAITLSMGLALQGCTLWGIFPILNLGTIKIEHTVPLLNRMEFGKAAAAVAEIQEGTSVPRSASGRKTVKELMR